MKITNWTRSLAYAIAAQHGNAKKFQKLTSGAIVGSALALGGAAADAGPIGHAINDTSFDDRDLTVEGTAFGGGHYAYIFNLNAYPWVHTAFADTTFNNNSWLYNTAYGNAQDEVTPLSPENAAHLADGNLFQILGDTFVAGRTYTLTAHIANQAGQADENGFGLRLFDGTSGMFDGANVFASANYSLGVDYFDDNSWHQVSLSFTAGAAADGKPIGILLGPEAAANNISVDDVSLTSVPEPATAALVGAGSVLIWQLVRRRRSEEDQLEPRC